jgi:hypothetical protein
MFHILNLYLLQQHLASRDETTTSKYGSLSTERLLALSNSKLRDLLHEYWGGRQGDQALDFLIELAGLKPASGFSLPSSTGHINHLSNVEKAAVSAALTHSL